jgi:hypothetical protein
MYALPACAPQEALRNLDDAFAHRSHRCHLKRASKLKGKAGYPQRKARMHGLRSFRLTGHIMKCSSAIQ